MILLVPRWGTEGAAVALLLSTTARFVFIIGSFGPFLGVRCPALVLTGSDLHFLSQKISRWIPIRTRGALEGGTP